MSGPADGRRIEPPIVVESFGDLEMTTRAVIAQVAATAHVEVLANRVRALCAVFEELDVNALSNDAREDLWRACDLMEEALSVLDRVARGGEDGE